MLRHRLALADWNGYSRNFVGDVMVLQMRKRPGRKPDTPITWLLGMSKREFVNPVRKIFKKSEKKK